jgi:Alpha-L-arabinofuranosidase B, catalytic
MRTILFVLALLGATVGRGQIFLDWYGAAAPAATLLLDDYQNSTGAYSLRLLRTAYTGDCIVVRRASNNDTLSVGFVSNYLDTVALKNFCSGTNCFLRRWYDQSGTGNLMSQLTNANQPQIVASGALIRADGVVQPQFDGTDFMSSRSATNFVTTSTFTVFSVANVNVFNTNNGNIWQNAAVWSDNDYFGLFFRNIPSRAILLNYDNNSDIVENNIAANDNYLHYNAHYGGSIYSAVNNQSAGTALSGNTGYALTLPMYMGAGAISISGARLNGWISELVFYNTDRSADRTGIQSNINAFYSIY